MAGVGNHNGNTRAQPLRNYAVEFCYWQSGGVEILRVRVICQQITVAALLDDAVPCEEYVNDIIRFSRAALRPASFCNSIRRSPLPRACLVRQARRRCLPQIK